MRKITLILTAVAGLTAPAMAERNTAVANVMHIIVGIDMSPRIPAESWAPQDPADAVWRAGRAAINNSEWQKAAEMFQKIHTEPADKISTYRGQSYYWEAYARAQMGGRSQLDRARTLLETLQSDYPADAKSIRDSASLLASVRGRLSKEYGDESAAQKLTESASKLSDKLASATDKLARVTDKLSSNGKRADNCPDDDDDNPRVAALNALMQMDAEQAMPILEKVLARRDPCSASLRARAMYMVAQKKTPRSTEILLDAIRNDPDDEVKQQAVYWLSQVDGEKAIVALEDILRTSKSEELLSSALFAIAQNKSPKANQILRDYATRSDIPSDVRSSAIHWLGEGNNESNYAFLKELFGKVRDEDSKSQIIYAISQRNTTESAEWLMNIVMDEKQDVDVRNQALYWSANSGRKNRDGTSNALTSEKLIALYDRLTNQEMKQQVIYAYAQRKDPVFIDKLMSIAKNDKDPELRKTAIYWLGQVGSKDPRVIKFLTDLING